MKDDFVWNDELVQEYVAGIITSEHPYLYHIESWKKFKASHQPKQTDWKESTKLYMEAMGDNPKDFPYQPQPKEDKPERDWEVVSAPEITQNWVAIRKIKSVRRLSDGEVFSVGDDYWFENSDGKVFSNKISRFQIMNGNKISIIGENEKNPCMLQNAKKSKPKEEVKEPERIGVIHIRENDFTHFGGNHGYTIETWGENPEKKYSLIKKTIEYVLNGDDKLYKEWLINKYNPSLYSQEQVDKMMEDAFNAARSLDFGLKSTKGIEMYYFSTFQDYKNTLK